MSLSDAILNDQKLQKMIEYLTRLRPPGVELKDAQLMSKERLASTYLDPGRLAKLKNCFFEYKKIGGTSIPELTLHRSE